MGFVGFSILFLGALGAVGGSGCVSETAKCSQFWEKIEPHKGLMETERQLNSWCRKQSAFYACLESVLLAGKDGNVSYLPTNLLISKLYAEDLCSDGSASRRRYLSSATCMNQLNTEFCTLPEYLDIVTANDSIPPGRCSLGEKTFSCIAASLIITCGFDAGKVYRNMLKITRYSDEVCDIEASQGIPHCDNIDGKETNSDRHEKLSEIYYGIVDRIGNIPGQEVDSMETPGVSKEVEYEVITETIKRSLDLLDVSTPYSQLFEDKSTIIHSETIGTSLYPPDEPKKTDIEPYKKYPIITQFYRGILFYNYSGHEYAIYWRQPDFTRHENISCEHLKRSDMPGVVFRCILKFRTEDPDCVSKETVHDSVTPGLVRDIDPDVPYDSIIDFGPRPESLKWFDEMVEAKRLRDRMSSSTTESPAYSSTDIPELSTASTLLHIAESAAKAKVQGKRDEQSLWKRGGSLNLILPDDIFFELLSLFSQAPGRGVRFNNLHFGDAMYIFSNDPSFNIVENVTCSRLMECHPRARGLFKCIAFPRNIEVCDECGPYPTDVTPDFGKYMPEGYYAKQEPLPVRLKGYYSKPARRVHPKASGEEDLHSSDKVVTLLFSGADESATNDLGFGKEGKSSSTKSNYVDDLISSTTDPEDSTSKDLLALVLGNNRSPLNDVAILDRMDGFVNDVQEETSNLDFPNVQIVVLEQNAKSQNGESSNYIPKLLYSVDDVKRLGDEPELVLPADTYDLFNDIILLQNAPDEGSIEDEYTFVDISGD